MLLPQEINSFHQCMIELFNKLELKNHKNQTNETVREKNDEVKLFLTMRGFLPFGTDNK